MVDGVHADPHGVNPFNEVSGIVHFYGEDNEGGEGSLGYKHLPSRWAAVFEAEDNESITLRDRKSVV